MSWIPVSSRAIRVESIGQDRCWVIPSALEKGAVPRELVSAEEERSICRKEWSTSVLQSTLMPGSKGSPPEAGAGKILV